MSSTKLQVVESVLIKDTMSCPETKSQALKMDLGQTENQSEKLAVNWPR